MRARPLLAGLLLAAGCSAFESEPTDIFEAARGGRPEKVSAFLARDPAAATARDGQGLTALNHAANAAVAQALITAGADVNAGSSIVAAPLTTAVDADRGDVVKVLLENGARVHDMGYLLRESARKGADRTVGALLDAGVPVDAADSATRATALHAAALNDRVKVAEVLIERGADVNATLSERTQAMGFRGPPVTPKVESTSVAGATPLRLAKSEKMKDLLRKNGARD